jgi:c-di-GMP-binding flagellar brake protein YcgR
MPASLDRSAKGSADRGERRCPRAVFSVPIHVRMLMPGGVRTTRGVSLDISEGGLGALVQSDLKPGDVIEIDLKLPGQELTTIAIVRHSSNVRSGFEFLGLTPEERQRLAGLVTST